MAELEPCRVCGEVPEPRPRWLNSHVKWIYALKHECETPYRPTLDEAAAEWNAAQASPDLAAIRAAVARYLGAATIYSGRKGGQSPAMEDARAALDALLGDTP